MSRVLSNLPGIERLQAGTGDGEDLRTFVRESPDGGWFPVIQPGNFYIGTEEDYLFGSEGLLSLNLSGDTSSFPTSGEAYFPSHLYNQLSEYFPLNELVGDRVGVYGTTVSETSGGAVLSVGTGITGRGAVFTGTTNTYLSGGATERTNLGNTSYTLVARCMLTNSSSGEKIILARYISGNDGQYSMGWLGGRFRLTTADGSGQSTVALSTAESAALTGQMITLFGWYEQDTERLWIQANQNTPLSADVSARDLSLMWPDMPFRIGNRNYDGTGVWVGTIDELLIYKRALTAGERKIIHQMYSRSEGTPSTRWLPYITEDPTTLGPVRVRRQSDNRYLQRVSSPLRAFRPVTLSSAGNDLKTAVVPGLLVQLCSHPLSGVFLAVPSTGDIVDSSDYTYDAKTGRIYLRDDHPPSIYATYLVDETDPSQLRQEEILAVDTDGYLRTQLSPVVSGSPYHPLIRKPGKTGTVSATGTVLSGNVISSSNASILPGDVVAVEYYARDTYAVYCSGSTEYRAFRLQYLATTSGMLFVEYETSLRGQYDTSLLPEGHPHKLQLNPLLSPQRSGFLFLVDQEEGWPEVDRIDVQLSDYNPVIDVRLLDAADPNNVDPYWWTTLPHVLATVRVRDAHDNPVPDTQVTVTVTGVSAFLTLYRSNNGRTDNLGELTYAIVPAASGLATLTISHADSAITEVLKFRVWDRRGVSSDAEKRLGKLFLHLEDRPYVEALHSLGDGWYRLNAYYAYPDGVPFQPDSDSVPAEGYLTPWIGNVYFQAVSSPMRTLKGTLYTSVRGIPIGATGVASVLVQPKPGEVFRAYLETPDLDAGESPRRRFARPVQVPSTSS